MEMGGMEERGREQGGEGKGRGRVGEERSTPHTLAARMTGNKPQGTNYFFFFKFNLTNTIYIHF